MTAPSSQGRTADPGRATLATAAVPVPHRRGPLAVPRWIRHSLIALAALLAVALAALAALLATFDANRYQGLLVDWVREHHQRTLVIGQPITLKVWPQLRVALGGVTLGEARSEATFATIESAELAVQWLPLLRRELVVDAVQVRGLQATWRRDAQGRSNLDDFLQPDAGGAGADPGASAPAVQAPAAPDAAAGAGSALRFDLGGARLQAVRLQLDDAQAGLAGTLEITDLQLGRFGPGIATPVTLDLRAALDQPAVQARLDGRLTLARSGERWRAEGLALTLQGDLPGARAVRATLAGAIEADAAASAVQARDLVLTLDAEAAGLHSTGSTLRAATLAWQSASRAITVQDLDLALKGTQGGTPLEVQLQWPALQVRGDTLQGSALKGRFARGGPMALAGTFQSGTPSGTFEAVQIPRLALSVQGRGTRSLQADVSADVQVAPSAARATVDRLALEARLEEPGLAPMQVAATGQARASATASSLELKGRFNQDPFEARVQATLGGKVPQIEASARFQALDLDRLLPRAAAAGASAPAGGAAAAADTPVDLAALRRLDARFDLAVGDLRRAPYRVGELALQGRLAGGELQLTTLRGRTWGGRFDLAARADARRADSQRLSLRGQVDEVDIRAALKDVLGREDVEGRGRVTLDLAAQGASVAALKASLAGQMALRLRDGAVRGFNIARALREARATLTLQRDAVQRARQAEKTDFSELTASFQFTDGVARSDDLDAKSPLLRLGGAGRIDLPREHIDYTVRATVASTLQGQDGAELAALKGVTVPVALSGPFSAVDWNVRWSQMAGAVVQEKAREKIDAAREKLEGRVAERLRDKLGLPAAASGAEAASAPSLKEQARDKLKDKLKGFLR